MNESIQSKLKDLMDCLLNKYSEQGHFDTELKEDTDFVGELEFQVRNGSRPKRDDFLRCNKIWKKYGFDKVEMDSIEPLYFKTEIPKE